MPTELLKSEYCFCTEMMTKPNAEELLPFFDILPFDTFSTVVTIALTSHTYSYQRGIIKSFILH